ncbi:23S rRNA (adenine(2030)-N(6))-methyltransferase RlmJ [Piscinibacterium candidicorallinum]|uniref:Ribosomal RNA large subunit methyltransferase J n=1 Tax=Piscinibacterium candidicorallinum TaxID=1793872 RepID=A0ABV7HCB2_9BURK
MFSYRHGFHAGNHADVLKHMALLHVVNYLTEKGAPLMVVDTHAGAGAYSLEDTFAQKSGEYLEGIARLWSAKHLPAPLARYVEAVRALNVEGDAKPQDAPLRFYPGSPLLLLNALRPEDKLRLFELHPTDIDLLARNFKGVGAPRQIMIQRADGFAGLKAFLPPPSRRAFVLIDPSYEDKADYARVADTVADALKRFPTCTIMVWYPVLPRPEARNLVPRLQRVAPKWVNAQLHVAGPRRAADGGSSMTGSGLFVINPPYTLGTMLVQTLPKLVELLRQDGGATHVLEGGEKKAPGKSARPQPEGERTQGGERATAPTRVSTRAPAKRKPLDLEPDPREPKDDPRFRR